MSAANYLRLCLSLALFFVTGVAALNWWADPCGIYHYGKSWDWIQSRPDIDSTEFIHKARDVVQAQPDVLLMGSSRTDEGLNPRDPALPPHAYNLGLAHSGMYEDWRYLQHACAAHMPQTVVLGVDIDGFAYDRQTDGAFSNDRLLVQPDGRPTPFLTRAFADLAPTLFSLSTVRFSLDTLFAPKGQKLKFEDGYEADFPLVILHMDLARNVLLATQKWVGYALAIPYRDKNGHAPQMDAFEHILALCAENHIHLIVFVQPVHSVVLDRYNPDVYADWMRALVTRMDANPALHAEFWDFAGYNSMSTEPLPLPTDKYSHMRYYWEGSHYRQIVGDLMLRRMFTGGGPQNFGQLVTTANVEQDLQRFMDEKRTWHEYGQAVPINPQ